MGAGGSYRILKIGTRQLERFAQDSLGEGSSIEERIENRACIEAKSFSSILCRKMFSVIVDPRVLQPAPNGTKNRSGGRGLVWRAKGRCCQR